MLGSLLLRSRNHPSRPVCRTHCTVCIIDMLSVRSTCPHGLKINIFITQIWHALGRWCRGNTHEPVATPVSRAKRAVTAPQDGANPFLGKGLCAVAANPEEQRGRERFVFFQDFALQALLYALACEGFCQSLHHPTALVRPFA